MSWPLGGPIEAGSESQCSGDGGEGEAVVGSTQLNEALEELISGRSPRSVAQSLNSEEARMLCLAQWLRGSNAQAPCREFVERLEATLRGARARLPSSTGDRWPAADGSNGNPVPGRSL